MRAKYGRWLCQCACDAALALAAVLQDIPPWTPRRCSSFALTPRSGRPPLFYRRKLARPSEQARSALDAETPEVVADRGYYAGEEILACEDASITVYLPKPMTPTALAKCKRPARFIPACAGNARGIVP
jgi:hypothetical protein